MNSVYDFFFRSSVKYWQKPTLNYTIYWVLAVFLGFTGLDYLYLGSPLMFVAKILLNFMTLGFVWIYDALNATFNQDQVKLAGPFIPGFGPLGIGGGRFVDKDRPGPSSPEDAAKAMNFMYYGFGLMVLGFFGVDSFMTGDTLSGFLRLGSLLTFIFAPVAILWYIFNLYRYFIRTDMCLDMNWNYFGAPEPAEGDKCPNVLELFTVWALQTTLTVIEYIPGLNVAAPILQNLIASLKLAYGIVKKSAEVAVEVAGQVVEGTQKLKTMQESLGQQLPVSSDQVKAAVAKATVVAPGIGGQTGGGSLASISSISPLSVDSSVLGLVAVGVVLTIIVSSVTLTFWRAYQNVRRQEGPTGQDTRQRGGEENNDDPPDPTAFGVDAE
jgi:TM2 domain-containing membrane protein YozV